MASGTHSGDQPSSIAQVQWTLREITKGEIVPEEGPHQAFEVPGEAVRLTFEGDEFQLSFDLPDGRTRVVSFVVKPEGEDNISISCPLSNLEPDAEDLTWDDRRLNEAINSHSPVLVPRNEWVTFFNDRLRGVFSSDWQIWWGDSAPD
jgi:hypothetical protein